MRMARTMVLLLASGCAVGAGWLVHRGAPPASKPAPSLNAETVDILVAARPVASGEMVGPGETRWQAWPRGAVPSGSILRKSAGVPPLPLPARFPFLEGEPIAEAKLLRPEDGSVLAALLTPGMRAASVQIRDETSAGGFIQAHDRVDVILTRKAGEHGQARPRSEIVLRGVKVLAIGKALNGKAANGSRNATLELTPAQARNLAAAESAGDISLALIGAADAKNAQLTAASVPDTPPVEVRVLKYGRTSSGPMLQ